MSNQKHRINLSVHGAAHLDAMKKDVERTLVGLERTAATASKALTAFGVAGGAAMTALGASSLKSGDELAKMSDKIGISTAELAKLHHITDQFTNQGAGAMNEALTKATKRLGEFNATGGGAAAQWLKEMNLDTQRLAELSPDQLFYTYAESIRGLNDRGQQLAAVSALMGDESRSLIGIIDAAPEALQKTGDEAVKLGLALTRVDAAKLEAANDAIDRAQKVFKGVGNTLAVEVAPYIEVVAQGFVDSATEGEGFKGVVVDGMEQVSQAVAFTANQIQAMEFAWAGVKYGGAAATEAVLGTLSQIDRNVTDFLNKIPGVTAEYSQELETASLAARMMAADLKTEMDAIAFAPPPGDEIKAYFDQIETQAQQVAERIAASRAQMQQGADLGGNAASVSIVSDDGLARDLEQLQATLMSAEEKVQASYLNRQFIIEEALQNELISFSDRSEMLLQIHADMEDQMQAISERAANQRVQLEQAVESQIAGLRNKSASLAVGLLRTLGQDREEWAYAGIVLEKSLAVAQINIDAAKARMAARSLYTLGPAAPAAIAAAEADIATTQAMAIGLTVTSGLVEASQVGRGGGGLSSSGMPGTGASAAPVVSPLPSSISSDQPAHGNQITIVVEGSILDSESFREAVTDALGTAEANDEIRFITR